MKQNEQTFEKYADKLLSAMKREALMNIDVAAIFHVPPSYMTNMRKRPEKVPERFMEMIRTWAISGRPLRGYQPEDMPDLEAAEMNQQEANEARDTAEMKFRSKLAVKGLLKNHKEDIAAAVAESVNTEEPTREEIAASLRQHYEQAQQDKADQPEPPQPTEETVTVSCKEGKVDLSKLDIRTGVIASVQIQIMEDGSFSLEYHPRR